MSTLLKLLAPYVAVGVFWNNSPYGWLALLAYHAQALFWLDEEKVSFQIPRNKTFLSLALLTLTAGPISYFLIPALTLTDIELWLNHHGISQLGLYLLIPYFGFIHPWIEQAHWAPLRRRTPMAHPLFAGYHVLVLMDLLAPAWLIAAFLLLTMTSLIWSQWESKSGSILAATLSHIFADTGIIVAACLLLL